MALSETQIATEAIFAAKQVPFPFPALLGLKFLPKHEMVPIAPMKWFLGGFVPHLLSFKFPGLPPWSQFRIALILLRPGKLTSTSAHLCPHALSSPLSLSLSLEG
jgi:hypothetical protein